MTSNSSYASKIKQTVLNITECAICKDKFVDPRQLSCHHTFCLTCLQQLELQNVHSQSITCPLCRATTDKPRDGLKHLPHNNLINELLDIENIEKGIQTPCQPCSLINHWEESMGYCIQCNEYLCGTCLLHHQRAKLSLNHIIFKFNEKVTAENFLRSETFNCNIHSKPGVAYCYDCLLPLCSDCRDQIIHTDHDVLDVNNAASSVSNEQQISTMNKLELMRSEIEADLTKLEEARKELDDEAELTEADLANRYEQFKRKLDEIFDQQVQNLQEFKKKRLEDLDAQKSQTERELLMVDDTIKYCANTNSESTGIERVRDSVLLHDSIELIERERSYKNYESDLRESLKDNPDLCQDWSEFMENVSVKVVMTTSRPPIGVYGNTYSDCVTGVCSDAEHVYVVSNDKTCILEHFTPGNGIMPYTSNELNGGIIVEVVFDKETSSLYTVLKGNPNKLYCQNVDSYESKLWSILNSDDPSGLSWSSKQNLLVCYENCSRIDEITKQGEVVRRIDVEVVTGIRQIIELQNGFFVICHMHPENGIVIADSSGRFVCSDGLLRPGHLGQQPITRSYKVNHIELDRAGNLLAMDYTDRKLVILNAKLKVMKEYALHTDGNISWIVWSPEQSCLFVSDKKRLLGYRQQ